MSDVYADNNDYIGSASTDVVGVYDQDFNQLFDLARPIKANINRPAALMDQPTEQGSVTSDFRIILPIEIELALMVGSDEETDTYGEIQDAFLNTDLLIVQTRMGVFINMAIQGMPHDESPEMADVVCLSLRLREVLIVDVQFQALPAEEVATPTDQSTVKRGDQTPQQSSVASDLLSSVFGVKP